MNGYKEENFLKYLQRLAVTKPHEDPSLLKTDAKTAFQYLFPDIAEHYRACQQISRGLYKVAILLINPENGDSLALKIVDLNGLEERAKTYIRRKQKKDPLQAFQDEKAVMESFNQLGNDHLSRMIDAGVDPTNSYFFFLERYSERTLANYVEHNHPLPYPLIEDMGVQLASGLAAMHQANRYHGDLKPDNILFRNAVINITDFDLASSVPDTGEKKALATYSCILAPELFTHDHPTPRSDLWAWASDMYFMSEGNAPFPIDFSGTNDDWIKCSFEERTSVVKGTVLPKIMDDTHYYRVLDTINNNFQPTLAEAVTTCFARDPNDRYRNAVQLYSTIESII